MLHPLFRSRDTHGREGELSYDRGGGQEFKQTLLLQVKLLFFAKSRELSGTSETELLVSPASELTGQKLLDIVVSKYPRFSNTHA